MLVADAQACLRMWFGSMWIGTRLLAIGMPSSVMELWIGQRRWRRPAWAVAIKRPTIALQLTRRNRGDFDRWIRAMPGNPYSGRMSSADRWHASFGIQHRIVCPDPLIVSSPAIGHCLAYTYPGLRSLFQALICIQPDPADWRSPTTRQRLLARLGHRGRVCYGGTPRTAVGPQRRDQGSRPSSRPLRSQEFRQASALLRIP